MDSDYREELKHDELTSVLPYLLAGLEGNTNGYQITSVAVQQAGLSGYRVVVRATGRNGSGDPVCVVGFTNSDNPGSALLLAEEGYERNLVKWKVDRFATGIGESGPSKNGDDKLTIVN